MEIENKLVAEIRLLLKFPDSTQEGLKIHHTAAVELIDAARRLHDKGLITQVDGGYLTELGQEALETAHQLLALMTQR